MYSNETKQWEYMEIEKFAIPDRGEMYEGVNIISSSGSEHKRFDKRFSNVVAILNYYGNEGWEVISVRQLEYNDEENKKRWSETTYTLKREIN